MKKLFLLIFIIFNVSICYAQVDIDVVPTGSPDAAVDTHYGGLGSNTWTAGNVPWCSETSSSTTGEFSPITGITASSSNDCRFHFADDTRLCFGNTSATPDGYFEWDTGPTTDLLICNIGMDFGGDVSASSFTTDSSSTPQSLYYDVDAVGADKADELCGGTYYNMTTTTEDAEVCDSRGSFLDAGTERSFMVWDGSEWKLSFGVMTNDYTSGDVAGYESIQFDFDTATDGEIGVSSPSGATQINYGSLISRSTGAVHGAVEIIADDTSLSAEQCYGSINNTNGEETITLPAAVVGMNVRIYSNDATVKHVDPNGTDTIILTTVSLGANHQIESPGAAGDYIEMICMTANQWTCLDRSGTWADHTE